MKPPTRFLPQVWEDLANILYVELTIFTPVQNRDRFCQDAWFVRGTREFESKDRLHCLKGDTSSCRLVLFHVPTGSCHNLSRDRMWQTNCRRMHNIAEWISGRQKYVVGQSISVKTKNYYFNTVGCLTSQLKFASLERHIQGIQITAFSRIV